MAGLVVVAMSGGVDSSVAAALLVEQGYRVIGVTLNVWPERDPVMTDTRVSACCSLDSVEDARRVADRLGIAHYTLNYRDLFHQAVIRDFAEEYRHGRTPNPCVRCNRFVKFDALLNQARAWGAEYLATGHYARVGRSTSGRFTLVKAVDSAKDQSYALYSLTQDQLSATIFPLGGMTKPQTRAMAADLGLVTAGKPESQEICFVQSDYRSYLKENMPDSARPGPMVTRQGEQVGTHAGVSFYTVGQRKRLGIATGKPMFVVEIRPEENVVVVGDEQEVYSPFLAATDVNWVSREPFDEPTRVAAKIRYRSSEAPAVAWVEAGGGLGMRFDQPQRAISPGQAVVLYDGDTVVAGATIVSNHPSAVNQQQGQAKA